MGVTEAKGGAYMRISRFAGGVASALAVAGGVVLAAPGVAQAATVAVDYHCQTPIGVKDAVSQVEVTAVPSGSGYAVTMTFTNGVSSSPVELGAGTMQPSALLALGGAGKGTVKVSGPGNPAAVPANTPIKIGSMTGTYTPTQSGTVTFTPATLTISALGTLTTCTPTGAVGVALSLQVTAAAGAQNASAAGSGTLPQTGPADDAVAFGLFGGTVLLGGVGGMLLLTRRSRRVGR